MTASLRLFLADQPVVFRLTEKEKVAVQERAMVALRVAILRKQTGLSLRQSEGVLEEPVDRQTQRFATPGRLNL